MSLTLGDLVAMPELKLQLHTSGPDVDRVITWVHVSELVDPTPFLTGGELLLTTGLAFDPGTTRATHDGQPGYVERLRTAGVVGLGFGTGLSHDDVPADLLASAGRRGLPVVEVPRQTPFIAISRAVSNAIAADEYAAVTRTFVAQQALTRAALSPSGPDQVVRLLAQQVGGWVVLIDAAGAPLASHPRAAGVPPEALASEIAKLRGHRGAVSSAFPIGEDTVSLQPVGSGQRRRAFLAVGRPGVLSAADRHLVNAAVLLLTIRLEQSNGDDRGMAGLRSAMVRLLLAGDVDLVRPIAAEIGQQLPQEPLALLAVLAGPDRPTAAGLERRVGEAWLAGIVTDSLVVIAGEADPGLPDLLAELAQSRGTSVGVAQSRDYPGLAAAHRQALQAAEFGRRSGGHVTRFADISAQGVTGLIDPIAGRAFADSLLDGLIEHDRTDRGDLLSSLRVWLAHLGQWDPAAAELGIHRHTLRNRMNTAADILGRSLDSPGTRSELWLALQLIDPSR
jgi:PucR family transcriptional regulator, purine catabolism regulatory protein